MGDYTGRTDTVSPRFLDNPWPDPDILVLKEIWVKTIAEAIREEANLDNWVRIAHVCHMPLGIDYLHMDMFWQEALALSANKFIKDQNKEQEKAMADVNAKMESNKTYQSAFTQLPMPTFIHK